MNMQQESPHSRSLFLPLLLTVLALFAQTLSATVDLSRVRNAFLAQHAAQEQTIAEAQKLRAQLESIAGETAQLAEQGNQNAIRIRDYLQKQGVKLNPPHPASDTER
jgi:hypothetical protein